MTDMVSIITMAIGPAPTGYEPIAYIFAGLIVYKTVELVFDLFRFIGGIF